MAVGGRRVVLGQLQVRARRIDLSLFVLSCFYSPPPPLALVIPFESAHKPLHRQDYVRVLHFRTKHQDSAVVFSVLTSFLWLISFLVFSLCNYLAFEIKVRSEREREREVWWMADLCSCCSLSLQVLPHSAGGVPWLHPTALLLLFAGLMLIQQHFSRFWMLGRLFKGE